MKRIILLLCFICEAVIAFSQTQQDKPFGAMPYGSLWITPEGNVWSGSGVVGYTNLGSWHKVDSLLALKLDTTELANYYTKLESDALLEMRVPVTRTINGKELTLDIVLDADDVGALTQAAADSRYKSILYVPSWAEVTGKPTEFPPSPHTHPISDVEGLQTALNGKQNTITGAASTITGNNLTASRALVSNSSGKVAVSPITATELGRLNGVTSDIQPQIDGKLSNTTTITGSGGVDVGGSLASGAVSIGLNDTYLNNRYLRKDQDDDNGTYTLTLGRLIAASAEITELDLPSLADMPSATEYLVVDGTGNVGKKQFEEVNIGVANGAGTPQFTLENGDQIRFAGSGDTDVSFNSSTNTVTINSVPGQGGGGVVTSVFGRDGGVTAEAGDYNTSLVPEGTNQYFTQARVRATPLTGLSTSTNSAVVATDNVLQGIGKLQAQVNNRALASRSLTVSGTAGRILASGGTQNLTSDREWTLDLAQSGVTAGTYPKVTVDTYGRVTGGAGLVAGDIPTLPISKISGLQTQLDNGIQTLSLGAGSGQIEISGGNSVALYSLSREARQDADAHASSGLTHYINTTNSVNYPTTVGVGLRLQRSGSAANGTLDIWQSTTNNDMPKFRVGATSTTYSPWYTFASQEWAQSLGLGITGAQTTTWPNEVASLDDVTTANGLYRFITTTPGNPTGSDNSGSVIIQRATSGYYTQLAQPISSSNAASSVRLFARHYTAAGGGSWAPWVEMWHNGTLPNPWNNTTSGHWNSAEVVGNSFRTINSSTDAPGGAAYLGAYFGNVQGNTGTYLAGRNGRYFFRSLEASTLSPWYEAVTSGMNQTGLEGNKTWVGNHVFNGSAGIRVVPTTNTSFSTDPASLEITKNTNGIYIQGFQNGSTASSFVLRGYASGDYQLQLSEGGVTTPNHGNSGNWKTAYDNFLSGNPSNTNNISGSTSNVDNVAGAGIFNVTTTATGLPWSSTTTSGTLINMYGSSTNSVQILAPSGGSGYTGAGLWWRERQGNPWKEIFHSGNFNPANYVPISRSIVAGAHLSGGGSLASTVTLNLNPAVNSYISDNEGNPRMYFGTTSSASNGWIVRGSHPGHSFQFRNSDNNTVFSIDATGEVTTGIIPWGRLTNRPQVIAGDGMSGGGYLTGSVTLGVDGTVVRTSGNQSISGTKTFTSQPVVPNATVSNRAVNLGQLNSVTNDGRLARRADYFGEGQTYSYLQTYGFYPIAPNYYNASGSYWGDATTLYLPPNLFVNNRDILITTGSARLYGAGTVRFRILRGGTTQIGPAYTLYTETASVNRDITFEIKARYKVVGTSTSCVVSVNISAGGITNFYMYEIPASQFNPTDSYHVNIEASYFGEWTGSKNLYTISDMVGTFWPSYQTN